MKRGQLILRGAGALLAAVIFFYAAAWVGIQLFGDDDCYLNPEKAKVVSPLGAASEWRYHIPNTGDYTVGLNAEGKPVFEDRSHHSRHLRQPLGRVSASGISRV